jgi:hypothetical protein
VEARYRRSIWLGAGVVGLAVVSAYFAKQSIPALAGIIDLSFAGLAFAALLDKRVKLRVVLTAFVLGLLVPLALGIFQVLTGGSGASTIFGLAGREAAALGDAVIQLGDGTRILRAYGSFSHPNIFGGYLAVGVLSILYLQLSRSYKVALGILLGLGLLLTASRSAVIGLAVGGLLTWFVIKIRPSSLAKRWNIPIATAIVLLALGLSLFAPSWVAAVRGGGALELRSLSERAEQYQEFPAVMGHTNWLIGNGPRSYVFTLATIHPDRGVWEYQPIHNALLLILAELGVLGLLLLLAWVMTLDLQNLARFPNVEAGLAHGMGKILFFIVFFDHYLWSSWAGLALVALVGALMLRLGEDSTKV